MPAEVQPTLNNIPQLYSNGRHASLISELNPQYKQRVLKAALLIIRAVVPLVHIDSPGLMHEISFVLSKDITPPSLSLVEFIAQKKAFTSKINGQMQVSLPSSCLLYDLQAQCLVSVSKLPRILLTCLGVFFGEEELTGELLEEIPSNTTIFRYHAHVTLLFAV